MKNISKLKQVLQLYTVALDMEDEELIDLTLISKKTNDTETFTHKSYTVLMNKAYGYMRKRVREERSPSL